MPKPALWMVGVVVVLDLLAGCAPRRSGLPAPSAPPAAAPEAAPQASPQPAPSPLLDLLQPVEPSPAGDFVASGLEGVVLYDRSGASKAVAAAGKRVRGLFWSPGGRWLLANAEGPSVWLIEPATGKATDLTTAFAGLRDDHWVVSWAPDDSAALVADGLLSADPSTVWLFTPATGSARKLTEAAKLGGMQWLPGGKGDLEVGAGCCVPVHRVIDLATGKDRQDEGFNARGSYAPNGRLFMEVPYMGASVTLRDMAAGTSRAIWRNVAPGDSTPADAARYRVYEGLWSPDSRFVAYLVEAPGALPLTLRVLDAVDGTQVRLVRDVALGAQWLPGGRGLLYGTLQDKTLVVHLDDRAIASHAGTRLERAVLSADGRLLAYAVTDAAGSSELFVVNLESGAVKSAPDSADLFPLMWTADGAQLLVAKMPVKHTPLPGGGGEAVGREVAEIRLIRP